jgi:hypothetical protein
MKMFLIGIACAAAILVGCTVPKVAPNAKGRIMAYSVLGYPSRQIIVSQEEDVVVINCSDKGFIELQIVLSSNRLDVTRVFDRAGYNCLSMQTSTDRMALVRMRPETNDTSTMISDRDGDLFPETKSVLDKKTNKVKKFRLHWTETEVGSSGDGGKSGKTSEGNSPR